MGCCCYAPYVNAFDFVQQSEKISLYEMNFQFPKFFDFTFDLIRNFINCHSKRIIPKIQNNSLLCKLFKNKDISTKRKPPA